MRVLVVAGVLVARLAAAAPAHVLYLDPCLSGGCAIAPGATDSRTDSSDLVRRVGVLAPWRYGPAAFDEVVGCVRSVLARFDIAVTGVDPGAREHLEIKIAGTPQQLGLPAGIGGAADVRCTAVGACSSYEAEALAFVFADVWSGDVLATCASAVQQIAHTWALDHVLDPRDPMTAFRALNGIPELRDGQTCGSDCVDGLSQFGLACTGTGPAATHTCLGSGGPTQDEVQMLLAVLGPATSVAPTLEVREPVEGAAPPGFAIAADCTSNDGSPIDQVEIAIDGEVVANLTAPPYAIAAPDIAFGAHAIAVVCATSVATTAQTRIVSVGAACANDGGCAATELCDGGACIAGASTAGGLGAACKSSADCSSGECASEGGDRRFCVVDCATTCPTGFACLADGERGACWSTAGGCSTSTPSSGALVLIILLAWRWRRTSLDVRPDRPTHTVHVRNDARTLGDGARARCLESRARGHRVQPVRGYGWRGQDHRHARRHRG